MPDYQQKYCYFLSLSVPGSALDMSEALFLHLLPVFFFWGGEPRGMRISLTRHQTCATCNGIVESFTGLPGNSQALFLLILSTLS